ncbi:hypothetical protein HNV11_19745 [Spirosoma taeanense]|uniref:Uncharacterized protein n=1 Tax=Spirosoma taeanense TaxID=2735870 RepID=A0A6M5YDS5_9BACT|nr:hypothetical protein [Spirosoma taeanense]QJW91451.1 hypothetical protein HNV11_19745 [Spirosoma taeanense]
MANQHSQTNGSSATTLIDDTIRAFDQGQAASPQEGMSLITDWFSSIKNNHTAGDVMEPLRALHEELQTGAPNPTRLQNLLNQLADQTEQMATKTEGDVPSRLTTLATALRNFAGQFSTVS